VSTILNIECQDDPFSFHEADKQQFYKTQIIQSHGSKQALKKKATSKGLPHNKGRQGNVAHIRDSLNSSQPINFSQGLPTKSRQEKGQIHNFKASKKSREKSSKHFSGYQFSGSALDKVDRSTSHLGTRANISPMQNFLDTSALNSKNSQPMKETLKRNQFLNLTLQNLMKQKSSEKQQQKSIEKLNRTLGGEYGVEKSRAKRKPQLNNYLSDGKSGTPLDPKASFQNTLKMADLHTIFEDKMKLAERGQLKQSIKKQSTKQIQKAGEMEIVRKSSQSRRSIN